MSKHLTAIILTISLALSLGLGYGFIHAVNSIVNPSKGEVPALKIPTEAKKPDKKELTIVGVGDSLTKGIGDAELKGGYVGRIKTMLETETNKKVNIHNFAVSGAESKDLLKDLERQGVQYTLSQADVIVMSIGGNDLNPGWDKIGTEEMFNYDNNMEEYKKNVQKIMALLRKNNKDAPILWLGLYHPFENIGFQATEEENKKMSSEISKAVIIWNYEQSKMANEYREVFVIPSYDIAQGDLKAFLADDNFHPNEKGYEQIADRMVFKIRSLLDLEAQG
jgi:lysophospholipase L1-like esterase